MHPLPLFQAFLSLLLPLHLLIHRSVLLLIDLRHFVKAKLLGRPLVFKQMPLLVTAERASKAIMRHCWDADIQIIRIYCPRHVGFVIVIHFKFPVHLLDFSPRFKFSLPVLFNSLLLFHFLPGAVLKSVSIKLSF